MELHLRSFRCYTKTDVRFKVGVTLLNGESGAGKSTILEAIDYVLYGKLRGQYAHGTESCSVKHVLGPNLWIQRNSGPGALVLQAGETQYKGDEAQNIINQMYGTREVFLASSYLKQGERCALMSGTNAEKMGLIRAVSFHDDNVEEAHEKIRLALKVTQGKIKDLDGELRLASGLLADFDSRNPKVAGNKLDLTKISIDDIEKQIQTESKKLIEITKEFHSLLQLESKRATLAGLQITDSDVNLEDSEKRIVAIDLELVETQTKIDDLQLQASKAAALKDLQASQTKQVALLESLKAEFASLSGEVALLHGDTYEGEIDRISRNIALQVKITALFASCGPGIASPADLRKVSADLASEARNLKAVLTELEKDLEAKKSNEELSKVLKCPKCSAPLHLDAGTLKPSEDVKPDLKPVKNTNVTEAIVKAKRGEVEANSFRSEKLKLALQEFNALYKDMNREKDGDQNRVNAIKRLLVVKTRLNDLEASQAAPSDVPQEAPVDTSVIISLRQKIVDLIKEKSALQNAIQNVARASKLKADFEEIKTQIGERTSVSFKALVDTMTIEIDDLKALKDLCTKVLKRNELLASLNAKREVSSALSKRAAGLSKLFETARQKEIQLLDDAVSRLNYEVNGFLDIMFPSENPMSVTFSTTRDSKSKDTKTMTCSLNIFYRNTKYTDPKQLSGGEGDRVSLAMMLALNAMLGSNLLLLDETLNTLDRSMKMNIVELLKRVTGDTKTCIVVSHEGVEGVYDTTISL